MWHWCVRERESSEREEEKAEGCVVGLIGGVSSLVSDIVGQDPAVRHKTSLRTQNVNNSNSIKYDVILSENLTFS